MDLDKTSLSKSIYTSQTTLNGLAKASGHVRSEFTGIANTVEKRIGEMRAQNTTVRVKE